MQTRAQLFNSLPVALRHPDIQISILSGAGLLPLDLSIGLPDIDGHQGRDVILLPSHYAFEPKLSHCRALEEPQMLGGEEGSLAQVTFDELPVDLHPIPKRRSPPGGFSPSGQLERGPGKGSIAQLPPLPPACTGRRRPPPFWHPRGDKSGIV